MPSLRKQPSEDDDTILPRAVASYRTYSTEIPPNVKSNKATVPQFSHCPTSTLRRPRRSDFQYWQEVGNTKDLYVYSAYYREDGHIVVVIGMTLFKSKLKWLCMLKDASGNREETQGIVRHLPQVMGKP